MDKKTSFVVIGTISILIAVALLLAVFAMVSTIPGGSILLSREEFMYLFYWMLGVAAVVLATGTFGGFYFGRKHAMSEDESDRGASQETLKDKPTMLKNLAQMYLLDQMRRERIRAIVVAAFELILGSLMAFIGFQLINFGGAWLTQVQQMLQSPYQQRFIVDMYTAIALVSIAGGLFALIHGIKRIIDNILNAWIKARAPL
jgi:hypothetical protein